MHPQKALDTSLTFPSSFFVLPGVFFTLPSPSPPCLGTYLPAPTPFRGPPRGSLPPSLCYRRRRFCRVTARMSIPWPLVQKSTPLTTPPFGPYVGGFSAQSYRSKMRTTYENGLPARHTTLNSRIVHYGFCFQVAPMKLCPSQTQQERGFMMLLRCCIQPCVAHYYTFVKLPSVCFVTQETYTKLVRNKSQIPTIASEHNTKDN